MKNVTLSIPDDIVRKARQYAQDHGTTLNDLIRRYLRDTVNDQGEDFLTKINDSLDIMGVDTSKVKYTREELHER